MALFLKKTLRQLELNYANTNLMLKAALACIQHIEQNWTLQEQKILVLVGRGNNAGDAWTIAHLLQAHCSVTVLDINTHPPKTPEAQQAKERFCAQHGHIITQWPNDSHWSLIIDGLLGLGVSKRHTTHYYAELIAQVNEYSAQHHPYVLALDCPSGLDPDTGEALTPTIYATHTCSFLAPKPGLYMNDGPDYCGQIIECPLDLPSEALSAPDGQRLSAAEMAKRIPRRRHNSHKGLHGDVMIIGGAKSMVGAALLAARSALKSGSGRTYVTLLDTDIPSVDIHYPELMFKSFTHLDIHNMDVIACGPGLGTDTQAQDILTRLITLNQRLVLDADALNLLARAKPFPVLKGSSANPSLIITPHPTEAARLLGVQTAEIQADRINAACQLAQTYQAITVLKGCGTVIATPDRQWWLNSTGNAGLATGGTGDVLTGLIASLWAQGCSALESAQLSVYIHGLAADELVKEGIGPLGLTASELINGIRKQLNTL